MTYAEMVRAAAIGAVNITHEHPCTDHDTSTEDGFRASFEALVDFAYRPEFAENVKADERALSLIHRLFLLKLAG